MSDKEKEILEQEEVETCEECTEETCECEETAQETEEEAADEAQETETEGKKKLFGKKKEKDASAEKIAELEDKVKRQLAEFENFRNRSEKEKMAMFETGAKSVIEKILPVIDNFERGFATVDAEDEEDAFVGGMRMVYKQMMTELEAIGVKPIPAVGEQFDPNLHNAVMQVENEELESGTIAEEYQKGYTYRDSVVRHSMVTVVS